MTGKADFTPEEWETVLKGPPSAGMIVVMAQRGGTFRESFSIAKAYAEVRQRMATASCWMRSPRPSPRSITRATTR